MNEAEQRRGASFGRNAWSWQNIGKRGGGFGNVVAVVFAEESGEGGGDLRLSDGRNVFAFAESGSIGSDDGDPNIFGTFLIDAMFFPVDEAAAAAVVGGDDESGLILVGWIGLDGVPKLFDKMIELPGAFKDEIVAARVSPIVCFAVTDEEHARMVGLERVEQRNLQKGIVDVVGVKSGGVEEKIVDHLLARGGVIAKGEIPADLHGEMAAALVEDVFVVAPGAEDGDAIVKFGLVVEPLEYGGVGIGAEFVGVDSGVGDAGEDFIVAGVGEGQAVGDVSEAAKSLIAKNLAFGGDNVPQKGQ